MRSLKKSIGLAALAAAALPASAPAAIVGYWRFEDSPGFTADSSGNGRTLTSPGGAAAPTQATLPTTGPGSSFRSIAQTGATSAKAASFDGSDRFQLPDEPAFTDNTFTIEAYFNGFDFGTNGSTKSIVGHFQPTGGLRSWLLAVTGSNQLAILLSSTGANTITVASGLTLLPNVDYYGAASVDVTDVNATGITFYLKDLTNGGALQVSSQPHTTVTDLFNSSGNFTIGATDSPSSPFTGLIDEVRLSDERLPEGQLLAVPEPSSLAVVTLLAGAGLLARRRTRNAKRS